MIKAIQAWLDRRAEAEALRSYHKGYDFAAGKLLRGELTPAELQIMYEDPLDACNPFDVGMEDAVDRLCQLPEKPADNRIH